MPQFQTNKLDIQKTRVIDPTIDFLFSELNDKSVFVRIEKFAFTANNITYGVAGDMIGYWNFFLTAGNESKEWGCIPVWGFARVLISNVKEIKVGERLYGYFPPSDYLMLEPGKISPLRFVDTVDHRKDLPPVYNNYVRLADDDSSSPEDENIRALLWPLHITSFCLCDYLEDLNYLNAEQIILLSASSKTAIGTAQGLMDKDQRPQIIGVTSETNFEFTSQLGCYDSVVTYNNLDNINPSVKTVIIDMAGNSSVLTKCQTLLGNQMVKSLTVGMTHWQQTSDSSNSEQQSQQMKDRTEFFFAPAHIQKRVADWGQDEFNQRTQAFMTKRSSQSKEWMTVSVVQGLEDFQAVYKDMAAGNIKPNEGIIVRVKSMLDDDYTSIDL